jgi:hypothetical protein
MKKIGYIAMQRLKSLKGQHVLWDTEDSDKTFRFNSRTYTTAASIIGLQTKPRVGVNTTDDVIGMESMPGINSGYTSTKGIVCFKAEPYLGSTHGAITQDIRGYEVSLGAPSGGGTISGVITGMKFVNNCAKAPTGGVYMLYALTHGDVVPWGGLANLPDDGQLAKYNEDKTGGTKGWIKVKIGAYTGYINVATLA